MTNGAILPFLCSFSLAELLCLSGTTDWRRFFRLAVLNEDQILLLLLLLVVTLMSNPSVFNGSYSPHRERVAFASWPSSIGFNGVFEQMEDHRAWPMLKAWPHGKVCSRFTAACGLAVCPCLGVNDAKLHKGNVNFRASVLQVLLVAQTWNTSRRQRSVCSVCVLGWMFIT